MSTRLRDRAIAAPTVQSPARPARVPDTGYQALASLARLRDQLNEAFDARPMSPWKEPSFFFFDRRRQADLISARTNPAVDPFAGPAAAISTALPQLFASIEVRRVARAIDGLTEAAQALAPACPPARDLADLLALPEDEVFLVLDPDRRAGFRLITCGVSDVGQFHVLLAGAVAGDPAAGFLPGPCMAARFVAACRDPHPATPGGVPLVVEARFQLFAPTALLPDEALPEGFGGCEHWLWPAMPLSAVPRIDGERVVLIGPPAFTMTWDVSRRFPALPAELRLIETLGPSRVAASLSRLTGRRVPLQAEPNPLSKAA
jgi:hypothetical protein